MIMAYLWMRWPQSGVRGLGAPQARVAFMMRGFIWLAVFVTLLLAPRGSRRNSTLDGGVKGGGSPSAALRRVALSQLLAAEPPELGQYDIALVNLACAEGLKGAENVDERACLATLDRWSERVRSETERHLYRYRANPKEFESSEGYFRMLMMAVVLYEDFSVRYNPERISTPGQLEPNDHFFADSRDLFLHGLLAQRVQSHGPLGTCSSMPVLYVAVGRRLGYPLKLATTKSHVFLRWEGNGERFDMEATGKGLNRYDDEHFKQWPFPVTEGEIAADGYLKSLSPAEELALFLSLRGHCLEAAGRTPEAVSSYAAAVRLAPASRPYRMLLAAAQQPRQPQSPETRLATFRSPYALQSPPASFTPPTMSLPSGNQPPDPNPLLKLRQP